MTKQLHRPLLVLIFSVFSFALWAQSGAGVYILEKSIDVLTSPGNFRKSEVIPVSTGSNYTVLKRVPSSDPTWWPQGVAIQIVSVNGREERPVRTVYVARKWFDRGTRLGEVSQLPDPQVIHDQVVSALTPVLPQCEVQVNEPELPTILSEPARPDNRDTYSTLAALVQTTNSRRSCQNALNRWYRNNSMWKDLSRKERADLIVAKAHDISLKMRVDGLVNTCAKASGFNSESDLVEMRAFMTTRLSRAEQARIDVTNYKFNCQAYVNQRGGGSLDDSYFRERTNDPQSIHPQFEPDLAVCIIKRETAVTDFDPHSFNYSFCELRGRQGRPRSTAHGLGQFTQTTFLSLRSSGVLPLSSVPDTTSRTANRNHFRDMSTDPDMQIESIFRYVNYLMKAPSSSRIRRMHDQVYNDSFQDWEKAVIAYDQDRASDYIKGVHSCRRCFQSAGGDRDAQARCLSGN